MARSRDYEQLAKLKARKNILDEKIKEVEKRILDSNPEKSFETEFGKLCLTIRKNFALPENDQLIDNVISQEDFNKHARISPSEFKKVVGTAVFDKMIATGDVATKEDTVFYSLKKTC